MSESLSTSPKESTVPERESAESSMAALLIPKPAKRGPRPRTRLRRSSPLRRSRRVRRERKTALAAMVRAADALFSKLILRDRMCRNCGGYATDTAHHYSRRHTAVRWHLMNASPLCRACHRYFTEHPVRWVFAWRGWVGPKWSRDLDVLVETGARKTLAYMTVIVAGLRSVDPQIAREIHPSEARGRA